MKKIERIEVNGEFLFELESKQQWVNRVPQILPDKIRAGETWVWVDKNGDVFECGADFMAAEKHDTYPCKVYRLSNVSGSEKTEKEQTKQKQRINDIIESNEFKEAIKAAIEFGKSTDWGYNGVDEFEFDVFNTEESLVGVMSVIRGRLL